MCVGREYVQYKIACTNLDTKQLMENFLQVLCGMHLKKLLILLNSTFGAERFRHDDDDDDYDDDDDDGDDDDCGGGGCGGGGGGGGGGGDSGGGGGCGGGGGYD